MRLYVGDAQEEWTIQTMLFSYVAQLPVVDGFKKIWITAVLNDLDFRWVSVDELDKVCASCLRDRQYTVRLDNRAAHHPAGV